MVTIFAGMIEIHLFRRESGRRLHLVLHRAAQACDAGCWTALNGECQGDETAIHAVERLVRQETGFRVVDLWALDYLHGRYEPQGDRVNVMPVFAVEVTDAVTALVLEQHDDARWLTLDQAMQLLRLPGQREGLRRLQEDILTAVDRGAPFRVKREG